MQEHHWKQFTKTGSPLDYIKYKLNQKEGGPFGGERRDREDTYANN